MPSTVPRELPTGFRENYKKEIKSREVLYTVISICTAGFLLLEILHPLRLPGYINTWLSFIFTQLRM